LKVEVDANIILNILRKEIDPKTNKPLWKSSSKITDLIGNEEMEGFLTLTSLMEITHATRVYSEKAGKDPQENIRGVNSFIESMKLKVIVPSEYELVLGLGLMTSNRLDPFDAINASVAESIPVDCIISRDETFAERYEKIEVLTSEEFLEKHFSKIFEEIESEE